VLLRELRTGPRRVNAGTRGHVLGLGALSKGGNLAHNIASLRRLEDPGTPL
jgi:hypothetical protein